MKTNKIKQLEKEIKQLAEIENAFKALGKDIYKMWRNYEDRIEYYFDLLEKFHKKITKLKENKK